ncbi:phosphoribosyltransferase [Curtobacterium ammoniigenes]|uniref:phosphoribosyltransferase n=1 Tax=Curtobacterium ammoniigenes TaxID=395387 RepID=UPI0009FADAD5|nr:phosphoribosyltransferase [Curtobacterium ammoniigenes]
MPNSVHEPALQPDDSDPDDAVPVQVLTGPERLGWLEFGDAARILAQDVADSGFDPDVVVAVARGGLIIAGAVAYALDAKQCGSINVEFYSDVERRGDQPIILAPALDAPSLRDKRVLIVDDVSDSGRTLALVVDLVRQAGADVRTACLYAKPGTILEPDFVWRRVDGWITFPWSALAPVTVGL